MFFPLRLFVFSFIRLLFVHSFPLYTSSFHIFIPHLHIIVRHWHNSASTVDIKPVDCVPESRQETSLVSLHSIQFVIRHSGLVLFCRVLALGARLIHVLFPCVIYSGACGSKTSLHVMVDSFPPSRVHIDCSVGLWYSFGMFPFAQYSFQSVWLPSFGISCMFHP